METGHDTGDKVCLIAQMSLTSLGLKDQ